MELIIFDLMIMESAVTKVPEAEKDSLMNLYSNQLLEIHGIDQEGLDSMMNYLKINQEMASELFQNVNIRLDTFKKRN